VKSYYQKRTSKLAASRQKSQICAVKFFRHIASRRPTALFQKLQASYFVLLPHRRCPPLPIQYCSSRFSQPVPLTLHWKPGHAACCSCCPGGHREPWASPFSGSVPQVWIPFTSSSKQHNHNAWATQGRFRGTGQGAGLAQRARCTQEHPKLSHSLQNSAETYDEDKSSAKALARCSDILCRPVMTISELHTSPDQV